MKKGTIRGSLDASVKDGVAWSVMTGFAEAYVVPFALALGAGSMGIGILRSLGPLLTSLAQLKTADIVNYLASRKRFLSWTVLLQVLSLAAAGGCAFLPGAWALPVLIAAAVIFTVSGALTGPPWISLMGEYLPASKRGVYLGWRSRLVGVLLTLFTLLAGGILDRFGKGSLSGFALLFGGAAGARFVSWWYLMKMHEPPFHVAEGERFSFAKFASKLGSSNFAAFTFACGFYMFAVHLSAPFFAVYMLEGLGFGYLRYMAVTAIGTLTMYISMRFWGRWSDAIGGAKVMKVAVVMIPIIPVLWLMSRNVLYLTLFEAFSGFAWSAYMMGTNNFIYDAVTPSKRTRVISYFTVVTGLGQALGPLVGGWLYTRLPLIAGYRFTSLLLLTAFLRILASIVFIKTVREVKKTDAARPVDALQRLIGQRVFLR